MILLLHRIFVALIVLLSTGVYAEPWTNATCTNPQTTWTVNSLGQSPCLVTAFLGAVCRPDNTWVVPALDENFTSYGPGVSNKCMCNSVVWSLAAACSLCQGLGSSSWAAYSNSCLIEDISLVGVYPAAIPPGVAVPNWAYYNYLTTGVFNLDIARQQTGPESTAPPRPSSTATSISTVTTSTAPSNIVTSTSVPVNSNNSNKTDTGAIIGGVVGGVLGIALFALVAFIIVHKSKQKKQDHESPTRATTQFDATPASYGKYQDGNRTSSLGPTTPSYKPYDPSNPAFSASGPNGPNFSGSVPNLYYEQNVDTQPPRPNMPQP